MIWELQRAIANCMAVVLLTHTERRLRGLAEGRGYVWLDVGGWVGGWMWVDVGGFLTCASFPSSRPDQAPPPRDEGT